MVGTNSPFVTGQTAVGLYTYYVTETQNGCQSPPTTVTLEIYVFQIRDLLVTGKKLEKIKIYNIIFPSIN